MDEASPGARSRGRGRGTWLSRCALAIALLVAQLAGRAAAQESGGSFGGWDDEPSGGSDWGSSSGSSDWGSSSGSSDWGSSSGGNDYAAQQAAEEEARRAAEAAEAERLRREEEERLARERARKLALPPIERARELTWPERPPLAAPSTRAGLDAPLASPAPPPSHWAAPEPLVAIDPPASTTVIGPMDWGAGACCGAPVLILLAPLAWLLTRARAATSPARTASLARAMRVSIAFDWTARARLQSALRAMSARHDMKSRAGLHASAQAIAQLLSEHAGAARYMTWELARGDARSWFMSRAGDLRARFRHELQRNERAQDGPSFVARADEGQGLVVVSVLLASRTPLAPLPASVDAASLTRVLRAIVDRPSGTTQGLEVIWSPAADDDRMSSYELEQRYPELQRTGDGVGRVQCGYCRAPFPRELGRCPACGAPLP